MLTIALLLLAGDPVLPPWDIDARRLAEAKKAALAMTFAPLPLPPVRIRPPLIQMPQPMFYAPSMFGGACVGGH